MTASLQQEIAAAEARAAALREQSAAIDEAGLTARRQARSAEEARLQVDEAERYNQARSKAEQRVLQLANSDGPLDIAKLFAAFVAAKDADARCEALGMAAGWVDPPGTNVYTGAPTEGRRAAYASLKLTRWNDFLEQALTTRYERLSSAHAAEIRDQISAEEDSAERAAREAAQGALAAQPA